MIIEGLITTADATGGVNIAPMGCRTTRRFRRLLVRPFETSHTHANLVRERAGVFHVTDDVELIARAAVRPCQPLPPLEPAPSGRGWILSGACRWYAFRVTALALASPRARMLGQVVEAGRIRDFVGFNRAAYAVVEAAILATRLPWCEPESVRRQLEHLAVLVAKTGGGRERRAFAFLEQHLTTRLARPAEPGSTGPT